MKQKGNALLLALGLGVVAIGLGVLLYPRATDRIYKNAVAEQKEAFTAAVSETAAPRREEAEQEEAAPETPEEPYAELYALLQQENERIYTQRQSGLKDPFSYEQSAVDLSAYGLEGNTVGFLTIPKMEIELPILLGASQANMQLGAAHLTETSYPIGGKNSNCVLAAHRGYAKTAMFRDIELLEIGDEVSVTNFRETLRYRVAEIRVVQPEDIEACFIQPGRDLLTLSTCHPLGQNHQRYLVFCERSEE